MWAIALVLFCVVIHVFNRLTCGKTKSSRCLIGKTAIVTGGNAGLGYQICLNLASRGCRVIIADKDDSEESRDNIIKTTRNSNVISTHLDLSSFRSVRNFAKEIKSSESGLDILIHNAAVATTPGGLTEDGLDPLKQINYYSPFLLTHLLIDLLKKSAPSRIIFTSSSLAFCGHVNPKTFNAVYPEKCNFLTTVQPYADAKLATLMASDLFAEKLKSFGVTSNSFHPGSVNTDIFRRGKQINSHSSFMMSFSALIARYLGKSVWEGSQTATHLAVSGRLERVTGKYFWDCREFVKPFQARNGAVREQLWVLSEQSVKLTEEEKIC